MKELITLIIATYLIYYFFIKSNKKGHNKNIEIKVINEPETKINGYFGHTTYDNVVIKYKGKNIDYNQLKKILFQYINFEDDIYLIFKMIDDEDFLLPLANDKNRIINYKNIAKFIKKNDLKEYFKDWVKQAEHQEIKNFAWLLAEKGILLKKKEKNRVYYKYNEDADIQTIFKDLFDYKNYAVEVFIVNRIIDALTDEECNYIEIENSFFDKNLIGIYDKLETPITKGCLYEKSYALLDKPKKKPISKYKTLQDILDELL